MNSASAVAGCSRSMRKLMKKTMPERAEEQHDRQRAAEIAWPNGVSANDARRPRRSTTAALIREPGDNAGECDAGGHVVVDAKHVGAQARIDRGRPRGAEAGRAA